MKAIHKLYFHQFLQTSVLFFLVFWAFDLFRVSAPLLWEIVPRALLFGLLITWSTITSYVKGLKKDGLEITEETLRPKVSRTVRLEKSGQEMLKVLKDHPIFGNSKVKEVPNGLEVYTGTAWTGMGQKIRISVEEGPVGQMVKVSSEPRFPLTLMDNGKNRNNVESIVELIKTDCGSGS